MLQISHHDIHPIWRKKRRKKVQNVRLIAIIFVFFLTIFTGNNAVTPLGPEDVFAQDKAPSTTSRDKDVRAKESKDEGAKEKAPAQEKGESEGLSPSEQIVGIQSTIESARKELNRLKGEHKLRQEAFSKAGNELKKFTEQRDQKKGELEKIDGKVPSPDAEKLKAEIAQLEREYALAKKNSDLAFQAEKTVREQIKALEEKIKIDTQTLDRLMGTEKAEKKPTPPPPEAAAKKTEKPVAPVKPHPAVKPLPLGIPAPAGTQKPPVQEEAEPEIPMRAEQIEARKEAEKKAEEAQKAASAIGDNVERKDALQKQIALEEKMLKTAEANRQNLEKGIQEAENQLTEKISAGAPTQELEKVRKEAAEINDTMTEIREEIRIRHTRLDKLKGDLDKIQEEQILATQEAAKKRKEASKARTRSLWLESPLHPDNILTWAATRGPKILVVFVLLALLLLIIRIFSKRIAALIIRHGPGEVEIREKRVTTLASTFRGALSGMVVICGLLFLLEVAGLDLKTVLGGAAVVGLAVAFGAQNLMRDYFNGFMILMEGQYELNDWIKIGDVSGAVERITLRITTLRDLEGCAHFIPNGEIKRVTNMTHKWSQALIDIGVTYREDVDRVMGILMDIAKELRNDGEFKAFIIDEPVMLGVNLFTESGVVIRMLITTRAGMQWAVRREMLRRVKNKFDEAGIEIPVPHRVIFQRLEKADG